MNVAFFLLPKNDVVYLNKEMPLKDAMQILQTYRYTALPIVDEDGHFYGVITEGDVLWYLNGMNTEGRSKEEAKENSLEVSLDRIPRYHTYQPVGISENMDSLIEAACRQSFVPVIDDRNSFIGIIRRQDIIRYYSQNHRPSEPMAKDESPR
jgi:CBS domain-containing protein